MTRDDVARAIAMIEESRSTHVDWIDHPEDCDACRAATAQQLVGDPEHHRRCVEKYDHVLAVLRSVLATIPEAA